MLKALLSLHDQSIEIRYPQSLRPQLDLLFGHQPAGGGTANHLITIGADGADRYTIDVDAKHRLTDLSATDLFSVLLDEVVHALIVDLDGAIALHAAAVGWGDKSIIIAGPSGAGKSSLAAWLVVNGFTFLSDELVALTEEGGRILGLPRPLVVKSGLDGLIAALSARLGQDRVIASGAHTMICPEYQPLRSGQFQRAGFIIFPRYVTDARCEISAVSAAQTGLKLMACNLNARNLRDHGFAALTRFARNVAAVDLRYGHYEQLGGIADALVRFVLDGNFDANGTRKFLAAVQPQPRTVAARPAARPAAAVVPQAEIPAPSTRKFVKKLTIGMATYDDYDGVYFTLQALRLYHPEILDDTEFVLVDNHPDGPAAQPLKDLEGHIPNYRYLPKSDRSGTAVRDYVFAEAGGDFVLCIDCHVLVVKGAVRRLLDYFDANPRTIDLLHGPLVYDDQKTISTHFKPQWRGGMYGTWDTNPAAEDPDAEPFEIPMQGLGLFACRRLAWPGFNPGFRGFGGEEGYIHEKFRRAGGRVLCLPFLRWLHRFNRPFGVPYVNTWEDRVRNYFIGFDELGLDTTPIEAHFKEFLGEVAAARILGNVKSALGPDFGAARRAEQIHDRLADAASERLAEAMPQPSS